MSVLFSGALSTVRARRASARRAERAEIAALEEEAGIMRRQAQALSEVVGDLPVAGVLGAPHGNLRAAELSAHEERLRSAVIQAWHELERDAASAFAAGLGDDDLVHPPEPGQPVPAAVMARRVLARNLARCDPAEAGVLARRARDLDADAGSAQDLERDIAASVDRAQRARQAARSRARIRAMTADALPDERRELLAVLAQAPDEELPSVANRVIAAVSRADQHRSRAGAARALAGALADVGCAVDSDAATLLLATGTAIAPLPEFSGYGLRATMSDGVRVQIVRRAGAPAGGDALVREAVSDRMGRALARLRRAGVVRVAPCARAEASGPIPAVSERHWDTGSGGREKGSADNA